MKPLFRKEQSRFSIQLFLLLLLALLLRLPNLGRDALWLDEAISYLAARLPLNQLLNNTIQSSHPPLYYLLLKGWMIPVPDTDIALKLLSTFFNILLIPAIYYLAWLLLENRKAALIAGFFVAISPFQVLYSHELRMYTLVMLLVTLLTAAYWRAQETLHWGWWALFGLLALAGVYTHLFTFFVLAGIGLHAFWQRRQRKGLWRTILVIAVVSLLFLPWLNLMLGEAQQNLGSLRPLTSQTTRNPLLPLTTIAFLLFGQSFNPVYTGLILFSIIATSAIFFLDWRKIKRQGISPGLGLAALTAGTAWGLPVLIYLVRPFFLPERTMAAAAPFLLILAAWLATRKNSALPFLGGLIAILMLVGLYFYHAGLPLKPPYREVMAEVAAQRQIGDHVLHTSDGSYLPALRYVAWEDHGLLAGDPDPRKLLPVYASVGGEVWNLAELSEENGRLWVIVAREHSVSWQEEQLTAIKELYLLQSAHEIGGIEIFLFDLTPQP
jgi:uncharacterized membrane protein